MADERKQVAVRLPPDLIRRIGHLAVSADQTKQAVIEDLLLLGLEANEQRAREARAALKNLAARVDNSVYTEQQIQHLWAIQAMRDLKTPPKEDG